MGAGDCLTMDALLGSHDLQEKDGALVLPAIQRGFLLVVHEELPSH